MISEKKISIDEHVLDLNCDSPIAPSAFGLSDEAKIKCIQHHFRCIMESLGLNILDDSLKDTPLRVAKMYVNEIFSGLKKDKKPAGRLFENKYQYNEMLV